VGRRVVRYGRLRYVYRCRPARDCAATTTTTLPPGVPDLNGDWTLTRLVARDTCPEPLASGGSLAIQQVGGRVALCGSGFINPVESTVSAGGFAVDSGPCCGVSSPRFGLYAYREQLSAFAPLGADELTVTEDWSFTPDGSPYGRSPCEFVATSALRRVRRPCVTDADCYQTDACSRCRGGACRKYVDCR